MKSVNTNAARILVLLAMPWHASARDMSDDGLVQPVASVEGCLHTDKIWRDACDRINAFDAARKVLGKHCLMPPLPWPQRIDAAYAALKQKHATRIRENQAKITRVSDTGRSALDRQFANVRDGKWSGFDMESLSREMTDGACSAIEQALTKPHHQFEGRPPAL